MRYLTAFLFIMACMTAGAVDRVTVTIAVTNAPATGATLVGNGNTRTWTNVTTSATIATNLASIAVNHSATNLYLALAAFPFTGPRPTLAWLRTNAITLEGPYGGAMVFTMSGGWAQITMSTQSTDNAYTARWPAGGMLATVASNQFSAFVEGINTWATNTFNTNAWALTNYMDVGPDTHILTAGKRIHNGTFSNITAYIAGGTLSNVIGHSLTVTNLLAPGVGTNSVEIGNGAEATNTSTIAIGGTATALAQHAIAIGAGSIASGYADVVIGSGAEAGWGNGIALGTGAAINATNGVALGTGAVISTQATNGIAIGYAATVGGYDSGSVAIGANSATTKTNQIMLGSSSHLVEIPGVLLNPTITNAYMRGTNRFEAVSFPVYSISSLANGNNVAVPATNSYIRFTGTITANSTLCGLAGAQDDGRLLLLENRTGYTLTLANQSGVDPTPENRIATATGSDTDLANLASAILIRDASASRWRLAMVYPSLTSATNAIPLTDGHGTNLNTWASAVDKVPLTVNAITGGTNDAFRINNTNGSAVVTLGSNNVFSVSNLQVKASPTSGYVLTADASGNATWQAAAAGGWTTNQTNVVTYAGAAPDVAERVIGIPGGTNYIATWTTNGALPSSSHGIGVSSNGMQLRVPDGASATPALAFSSAPNYGLFLGSAQIQITHASTGRFGVGGGYAQVDSGSSIGWSSGTLSSLSDTLMFRDAPNTWARRNGTVAQTNRIYNTYTDASNYERATHEWNGNRYYVRTQNAGTGSARGLTVGSADGTVKIATNLLADTVTTTNVFLYGVRQEGDSASSGMLTINAEAEVAALATGNIYTYTPAVNATTYHVTVDVVAIDGAATEGAGYTRTATFKRLAGTVTQIGATSTPHTAEDDGLWDCTIDVSAGVIRVRGTADAVNSVQFRANGKIVIHEYN